MIYYPKNYFLEIVYLLIHYFKLKSLNVIFKLYVSCYSFQKLPIYKMVANGFIAFWNKSSLFWDNKQVFQDYVIISRQVSILGFRHKQLLRVVCCEIVHYRETS